MNYKDLQNISSISHQILSEAANEVHDPMNRWPYTSPYLQEERAPGVRPYKAGPTQAEVRADAAKAEKKKAESGKDNPGYGPEEKMKDWKYRATPASTFRRRGGGEQTVSQRMDGEKPYDRRMTGPMASEYGSRTAAQVTRVVRGPGEPQAVTYPRMGREERKPKARLSREIIRRGKQEEGFDLFDLVLSHLLDEGYAYNEEAATAIMANMSEEWVDSIVEVHGAWTRQGQSIHDYSSYAQEIGHDDPETRRELRNLTRRKGHGPKIAAHARNKANFDIERAAGRNPRTPEYRSQRRKTTS